MRIGVLADTHIPDRTNELPEEIFAHFQGVDLILHAGDVSEQAVLDRLGALAPVVAVHGNRDRRLPGLPRKTIINAGPWRIGLIHGTRSRADLLRYLGGNTRFSDQRHYVRQAFAGDIVHCIVFGHTHHPYSEMVDGVLLFNPGGVLVALGGRSSSVGLLDVNDSGIVPHIITLDHPPHPLDRLGRAWLSWSQRTRR